MKQDRYNDFNSLVSGVVKSMTKMKLKKTKEYGIGSAHTACLLHIHENEGGVTQTDLVRLCEVDKAQISRVMAHLLKNEFVYQSPKNSQMLYRRRYLLTEKGQKVTDEVVATIQEVNNIVSRDISMAELEIFYKTFTTIFENLKEVEKNL